VLEALASSRLGLPAAEGRARLARFGPNALPRAAPSRLLPTLARQFKSPLVYVQLAAAAVSLLLRNWSDAGFIFAVLLIKAGFGTFQEYTAERSAQALPRLISRRTHVLRDGDVLEADAAALVPRDLVLLESSAKVPADLRLLEARHLALDALLVHVAAMDAPGLSAVLGVHTRCRPRPGPRWCCSRCCSSRQWKRTRPGAAAAAAERHARSPWPGARNFRRSGQSEQEH